MQRKDKENFLDKKYPSFFITILIVYSIITFSIETLPNVSDQAQKFLDISEIFVVGCFTAEYLYRLYVAENRIKFITSFYGVIDLLAIIPFYLTFALDLRALRLVRMFRLFRILKLVRYNAALYRMSKAFAIAKEELIISIVALLCIIYFAAFGIFQFEHEAQPDRFVSIFDALWWATVTVTTVGYGDIYPITLAGRLFTFIVLIAGLGLVAIPSGILASALFTVKSRQEKEVEVNDLKSDK